MKAPQIGHFLQNVKEATAEATRIGLDPILGDELRQHKRSLAIMIVDFLDRERMIDYRNFIFPNKGHTRLTARLVVFPPEFDVPFWLNEIYEQGVKDGKKQNRG